MAILSINKETGEYFTRYNSGGICTIHFKKCTEFELYIKRNNVSEGDLLPLGWKSETKKFQYKHNLNLLNQNYGRLFNAKCPVCNKNVYYYENDNNSKVFFDSIGFPWEKHPCTNINKFDLNSRPFKSVTIGNETIYQSKIHEIMDYNGKKRIKFSSLTHFYAITNDEEFISFIKNMMKILYTVRVVGDENKKIYISIPELDKQYICDYIFCGKRKKVKEVEEVKKINIYCHLCDKSFHNYDSMYSHIREIHADDKSYIDIIPKKILKKIEDKRFRKNFKCPYCKSILHGVIELDSHLKNAHKEQDGAKLSSLDKIILSDFRKLKYKKCKKYLI